MTEIDLTAPGAFERYDEAGDEVFYEQPRLVTHIDDNAIAAVTQLYDELLPPSGSILDVMSSWVSHLPPAPYWRVVGLGMNAEELGSNAQLDQWIVHDLNQDPRIPFANGEFDGAGICVSIQYLTHPVEVLRDLGRVLAIGAPLVITFSNRCFPTKAVMIWQTLGDRGHLQLVQHYLEAAGNWTDIQVLDRSPGDGDPLYAVVARSTGPLEGDKASQLDYLGQLENAPRPTGPQMARLDLPVTDPQKTRRFYEEYFGFAAEPATEGGLRLRNSGGFVLALVPTSSTIRSLGLGFRLEYPEAVQDLYGQIVERGLDVFEALDEADYVGFNVRDPDGYAIQVFWSP